MVAASTLVRSDTRKVASDSQCGFHPRTRACSMDTSSSRYGLVADEISGGCLDGQDPLPEQRIDERGLPPLEVPTTVTWKPSPASRRCRSATDPAADGLCRWPAAVVTLLHSSSCRRSPRRAAARPGRGSRDLGHLEGPGGMFCDISAGHRVQSVGVQIGEHLPEGALAGHQAPAGQWIAVGSDPNQLVLRGTGGPLPDRRYGVAADYQRRARGQHQDHHQRMPSAMLRAPVRYLPQPADQRGLRHRWGGGKLVLPQGQVGELTKRQGGSAKIRA
jgi:hypothetical protein